MTLSAIALAAIMFFTPVPLFPRSVIVMVWLWQLVLLGGVALRVAVVPRARARADAAARACARVVVGADHAGVHLIQEMRRSRGRRAR